MRTTALLLVIAGWLTSTAANAAPVTLGVDVLLAERVDLGAGKRVGLL